MPKHRNKLRVSALAAALTAASLAMPAKADAELSADFVYKYLVGEVAGQRGETSLASQLFYDLARTSRDPRLAERAARAAAYGHQQQLAIRAAMLWAELDPASTEAQQAVAQMLLGEGKLKEARPYLKKLLAAAETRGNGFLYLNGLLARQQDKAATLALVRELAQPYPDLPEAHFTVAHSAWNAGKIDMAIKALEMAEALRPGWELAAMLHAEILQRRSETGAMAFYQGFLDKYPAADDVRLAYAKLLVGQKQFNAARLEFSKLAQSTADNPEVLVVIGLLSGQLGDYTEADGYFLQALDNGFRDPEQLYIYLGQSAEQQKLNEQALQWYRRVEPGSHHFDAQLRIAAVLAGQGKLDEARALLHELTDLEQEEQTAAIQVEANLLANAKRYAEAYALLEAAVQSRPNTTGLIYDYAMLAEKMQRYDVMERELRKLITIKPDSAQAYNALGYTLADRNERLAEAAELIEKAHALSPDDHYILDSMGWVQYRLGKLDKAAEYLRRAYTTQTDPEIAAHLGEVLWQQGKHDEAERTWEEALREHPDNEILVNTRNKFRR